MPEKKELSFLINKYYKIDENGKIVRLKKQCPKCGRYMAEHKDRYYCGYCGYTEYKNNIEKKKVDNIGIYI